MNPKTFKTPLAAAKSFAAENKGLSARIEVRYVRPRTGHISQTRYYADSDKVEPDRGYWGHRNGLCPHCGRIYTECVIDEVYTQPEGNLSTVACEECARRNGWSKGFRPGMPQPDPNVRYQRRPETYIFIDMVHGLIENKEYDEWR